MATQRAEAHIYFSDSIGMGDWFYGTTLNDVRYCVEGWAAYDGGRAADGELPSKVVLHFPYCLGGSVPEGYGIFNYLRELAARGVAVEARIEGYCASIAVLVALAADVILMADAALLMVHKPSACGDGNADELRAQADILDKIQAQLVGRYVARGVKDTATANELINRTTTLNADECLAYGFITGKLHEDPITVPEGAEAVLNYFPTNKTAPMATLTPAEKKGFFDELKEEIKGFVASFKNEAPAPEAAPVTNTSSDVDGDTGPMYYAEAELAVGVAVYSDEALTVAYADNTYTLTDGREVVVTGGMVETLSDPAATDEAPAAPATNALDTEALTAENAALQASNALLQRKLTAANNKLKAVVPGSTGNPTPAGAAQQSAPKNTAGSKPAGSAFTIRKN